MKRTFKRTDGTEEVLEGTAEELAEYERKLNESEGRPAKPGVLKGKGLEAVPDQLRMRQEAIDRMAGAELYWPSHPIWVTSCSTCGRVGCVANHWDAPRLTIATATETLHQKPTCLGSASS